MNGAADRPLRVAIFVNSLPPMDGDGSIRDGERFGGVQRACWHLSRALAELGDEVWVFAGGAGPDVDRGAWHIRFSPARLRVGQAGIATGLWRDPGRALPGADVVLAYMGDQPAPTAALHWARRWNAPLAVSYHGDPVGGFGSPARRLVLALHERWLGPRVLRAADAVLVLSGLAGSSSRLVGRLAKKPHVIPNGVAPGPVPPISRTAARAFHGLPPDAPVILFVGSLTPIKGVDILLDAFARVADGQARLVVVGGGPDAAALQQQAVRTGVGGRVTFRGFVTERAKQELMAAADILAMPSRSEAFPLTLLEAGIVGLPAVVSAIPPLQAIIHDGQTGWCVMPEDSLALAQGLQGALADREALARVGARARDWALGFTWPAVARQTHDLLAGLR